MQYIDSHVHFWDLSNKINAWVLSSNDHNLIQSYGIDSYLCELFKPTGIVTIEASDSKKTLDEVKWIQSTLLDNKANIRIKHIAYIDITTNIEAFRSEVDLFKKFEFIVGFRDIQSYSSVCKYSPRKIDITEDKALISNMKKNLLYLKKCNYIFNCQMYPDQLIRLYDIFTATGVNLLIDHLGLPGLHHSYIKTWNDMINLYGAYSKFKVSGLEFNIPDLKSYELIDICLNKVSSDNLLFGSNYPCTDVNSIKLLVQFLNSINDLVLIDKIFLRNAVKTFQF